MTASAAQPARRGQVEADCLLRLRAQDARSLLYRAWSVCVRAMHGTRCAWSALALRIEHEIVAWGKSPSCLDRQLGSPGLSARSGEWGSSTADLDDLRAGRRVAPGLPRQSVR